MSHSTRDCVRLLAAIVVAIWAGAPAWGDDLRPEILALAKAGRQFKEAATVLSSFACLETVERAETEGKSGKMRQLDRVDLEVTRIGHQEWYSWPGGDTFEDNPARMIGHGMMGTGEFLVTAQSALAQTHPIAFAETTEVAGRKSYRFTYEISPYAAKYHVKTLEGAGDVGIRGSVWIDVETFDVLRISSDGWQMPAELGLDLLETTISYQRIPVNQQEVLFPESAEVSMHYVNGHAVRNTIGFSHCRSYETSSRLVADAASANAPPPELKPLAALPGNLRIELELRTPIDKGMRIGTPIEAKLVDRLRIKGTGEVVPRGAQVLGRVRRLGPCLNDKDCWEVGIEFNEIDTQERRYRFVAYFAAATPLAGLTASLQEQTLMSRNVLTGTQTTITTTTTTLVDIPGTVSFFLTAAPFRLPAGLGMTWITTKPAGAK